MRFIELFIVPLLLIPSVSFSDGNAENGRIDDILKNINPNLEAIHISQSPSKSLIEVETNNMDIVYITEDGNYLLTGKLIDVSSLPYRDTTENRIAGIRATALSNIDDHSLITFSSKITNSDKEIYVFTDVSCAYCIKFHEHIDEIIENGVTVHYLAFPRAGLESPAAVLMDKAWCASDQQSALTEAKEKGSVSQSDLPCRSPMREHIALAQRFSVSGTPAIYSNDGRRLGGYLPPSQLLNALE